LAAKTICDLYKARWEVELFFKTMKQYLQVKKFVGTSVNAVTAQVWVALIAYLLVMMVRFSCKLGWSFPAIMAGLTMVLFANKELIHIWGQVPKERCASTGVQQLLPIPV
jgi:transposase